MPLSKTAVFVRTLRRRQAAEPQQGSGGRRPPEFFADFDTRKVYSCLEEAYSTRSRSIYLAAFRTRYQQRELPQKQGPSSLPQSSSPAQRELPQKQAPLSINPAAPRSESSPRNSLLSPSIQQPRAAGAPPETASSLHQSSSPAQRELPQKQPPLSINTAAPAQRELPQKQPPLSINTAAPRSGSSPRDSLLSPSIQQPRAAGAPPETGSFLHQSSSPAQRELPQRQPPLSINPAAPRSGSSPRNSLLSPSIQQPRAAGAPPETASSLHQSSSPAQRELPQKQAPSSINQAAPRSGSSPRNELLSPSIQQPRAAGAPPETASSLHQSSSPTQREQPQKRAPPSINPAAPRSGSSPRNSLLPPSIQQPIVSPLAAPGALRSFQNCAAPAG